MALLQKLQQQNMHLQRAEKINLRKKVGPTAAGYTPDSYNLGSICARIWLGHNKTSVIKPASFKFYLGPIRFNPFDMDVIKIPNSTALLHIKIKCLLWASFCIIVLALIETGDMKNIIQNYHAFVKSRVKNDKTNNEPNLNYWQDQLFYNFLVYCLPVSLLALIPGIIMSFQHQLWNIAVVDIICFLLIAWTTLSAKMPLRARKIIIIGVFYFLSFFLINSLGYFGPGVFYLFFLTVLVALIFPTKYAYWSVFLNAAILVSFAVIIEERLFGSALITDYTPGQWLAFSGNLIFASIIIVILINKIFEGLQGTLNTQRQLQDRYKKIFDSSPLPMWLLDTETLSFLDVNTAALRQYGYSKDEFLSMTIKDIRPIEQVTGLRNLVKSNNMSAEYYDGVSLHLKKNGEIIYVRIESNLLTFNNREARLVQATDITQLVEFQLEIFNSNSRIKESESNLRAIFDSALDGFVLLDKDCRIKIFNPRASQYMRFNRYQIPFEIGSSIFDYVESSRLAFFKASIKKAYSKQSVDYDRRYREKNGDIVWIRYTLTPVFEGSEVVGACINGRDVTARKLYLKNIEEQNKIFRKISWMQSHLVRAPLARIMGLIPLFTESVDENDRAELRKYLEISTNELDDIIREITVKSNKSLNT